MIADLVPRPWSDPNTRERERERWEYPIINECFSQRPVSELERGFKLKKNKVKKKKTLSQKIQLTIGLSYKKKVKKTNSCIFCDSVFFFPSWLYFFFSLTHTVLLNGKQHYSHIAIQGGFSLPKNMIRKKSPSLKCPPSVVRIYAKIHTISWNLYSGWDKLKFALQNKIEAENNISSVLKDFCRFVSRGDGS